MAAVRGVLNRVVVKLAPGFIMSSAELMEPK
jgi:hypothetical protein